MSHPFAFGDTVICGGDANTPMIVTGFTYRKDCGVECECAYWLNGTHTVVWLPVWRLTKPDVYEFKR